MGRTVLAGPERFRHPIETGRGDVQPGYELERPRGLSAWLIWLTLRGACWFEVQGEAVRSPVGEAVLIRPGVRQCYGSGPQGWACVWAVFEPRPHWVQDLRWPEVSRGLMRLTLDRDARAALVAMDRRNASPDLALLELERALILSRPQRREGDPRLHRALEWIHTHLNRPVSVDDIAQAVGLSAVHLRRLFRAQMGCTPLQYHESRRLDRAASLLKLTAMSVTQIAHEMGYDDPFYFSARFTRKLGRSPRAFRGGNEGGVLAADGRR